VGGVARSQQPPAGGQVGFGEGTDLGRHAVTLPLRT
jgi:hypothetical protein